jgi:hypothetical protein
MNARVHVPDRPPAAEVVGRIGISPNRSSFRLGGLRTHVAAAAYTVKTARDHGLPARLVVRIDDTNHAKSDARHIPELLEQLTEAGQVPLRELGTGHGPLIARQSERTTRYQQAADELMSLGLAAQLPDRTTAVVMGRDQLLPCGSSREPGGTVTRIMRSDGSALWHLAAAVDDLDYQASVCVRGMDKLSAEPVQRALIQCLGGTPPAYHYLPRVLPASGTDLVSGLRDAGFRDITLFSYIAASLLGDGTCRTFEDLAARITLRSDFRQHVLLDHARLAKLERQLPAGFLSGPAMHAALERYSSRTGDQKTRDFLSAHQLGPLLERYPRSLLDQYRLAASLAHGTRESPHPVVPGPVYGLLRHSADDALAYLTTQGMTRAQSCRLLRWVLCGLHAGPDPAGLWDWHAAAGTLSAQVSGCAAPGEYTAADSPGEPSAGPCREFLHPATWLCLKGRTACRTP